MGPRCSFIGILLAFTPAASVQSPFLYLSRPGQILQLVDLNADGDYLDFGEITTYATGLPASLGAVVVHGADLYVVTAAAGTVLRLRDLNLDGDASDFDEAITFAQPGAANLVGLTLTPDGALASVDTITGQLYRFIDFNADGDALDFAEATVVASSLTSSASLTARLDGVILSATNLLASPVRILQDRNSDADFSDFAENLAYCENFAPGTSISAANSSLAYLARPSDGRVLRLDDLTADNDALDFGEVTDYALIPSATHLAAVGQDVFVWANDAAGSLYRLRDENGDGDALDFGEALLVAQVGNQVGGIAVASVADVCVRGDLNANGVVDVADLPGLVDAILMIGTPPDPCRADANADGTVNGKDVAAWVHLAVP